MRLQKQSSRGSKEGVKYYKWVIVIPENIVKKAGFKEGDKLEAKAKKGEIRLRK